MALYALNVPMTKHTLLKPENSCSAKNVGIKPLLLPVLYFTNYDSHYGFCSGPVTGCQRLKKGISAKELQRKLGVSYQTAWTLAHKIRIAMKSSGKYPINNEVEFDETCLGKADKKYDKGRAIIKAVVEVDPNTQRMGRAYIEHIQSEKSEDVKTFIHKTVKSGCVIRTDGKKTYIFQKKEYKHHPHKKYDKKDNEIHLPKVHIVIANLKMWLRGMHNHLPYKHSQRYLDEFDFRFNRRWKLENIFEKLMTRAIERSTLTYAELTG